MRTIARERATSKPHTLNGDQWDEVMKCDDNVVKVLADRDIVIGRALPREASTGS